MNTRWSTSSHATYNCGYHFIWCPKYRKKVLIDGVDVRLKELLYQKAEEHGWNIEKNGSYARPCAYFH
jgi:putative transposase